LEKLRVEAGSRFDLTVPDLFDIIGGNCNSNAVEIHDMYTFLQKIGVLEPVVNP
jgi:hypothetical protein